MQRGVYKRPALRYDCYKQATKGHIMETTPRDLYVLVQEDPEGLDHDADLTGVFTSESAARAYADEYESEPIVWGVNPAYGDTDESFGSTGGSGFGWRVYRVANFC